MSMVVASKHSGSRTCNYVMSVSFKPFHQKTSHVKRNTDLTILFCAAIFLFLAIIVTLHVVISVQFSYGVMVISIRKHDKRDNNSMTGLDPGFV